ncbi:unnamed protein product, partial [Didymodactylos carnosus]
MKTGLHPLDRSNVIKEKILQNVDSDVECDTQSLLNLTTTSTPVSSRRVTKLYTNDLHPAYCSDGFAKAGIYPYDKKAIPREKISYSATSSSNSGQPCLTRTLSNEYLLPVHGHMTNNTGILNNNESGYYRLRRSPSAPLLSCTLKDSASGVQNAITTTLQRYLTPTIVRNTQRKTMVERSSDKSLTSVEVLHQLQRYKPAVQCCKVLVQY